MQHIDLFYSINKLNLNLYIKNNIFKRLNLIGKFFEDKLKWKEKMEFGVDDVVLLGDADPNVSDFLLSLNYY